MVDIGIKERCWLGSIWAFFVLSFVAPGIAWGYLLLASLCAKPFINYVSRREM